MACRWAEQQLAETPDLDARERHRAEFYLRQLTSAFSPTNFLATNPEVLRETLASNARNLLNGADLLADDLKRSGDLMKISQTDANAFELGRNLATTPGKVVFQNDLLQLIQYTPTTDKVRERPLLMVPPWINKYYILDLTGPKSFIKYVVDQGFTVFVVSWVNPDERLAAKTFEDYILEGILEAVRAVQEETGVEKINVLGYCVGGTALSTGLAYLAQRGEEPFKCCTLLATQVDFLARRRSSAVHRRYAARQSRNADDRARLSRRLSHGQRIQYDAAARPHLALRRQQLLARQEAVPVRSPVLEPGFDTDGGRQPRVLSARVLQ